MMSRLIQAFVCLALLAASCWAQPDSAQQSVQRAAGPQKTFTASNRPDTQKPMPRLLPVESVLAKDEVAVGFAELTCDDDANIYLGMEGGGGSTSIRKLNPKGELVTRFEPYAVPDVEVFGAGSFTLAPDGDLYTWVGNAKDGFFYVLAFTSDGHFKNKIKLDPGMPWIPASLAVFQNGNFLITGQLGEGDPRAPMVPFTAIFRSDGKLLKELSLEDDGPIYDRGKARDPKLTSAALPNSNRAIAWGRTEAAKDGNIYVMRWLSPAIFNVISPGGEVIRRFTVDAGNNLLMPVMMHVSGNRIAVLFRNEDTKEQLVKIVSLEGEEIATYDASPHGEKLAVGAAFACYSSKHTQFTFLASDDNRRIMLRSFEPR